MMKETKFWSMNLKSLSTTSDLKNPWMAWSSTNSTSRLGRPSCQPTAVRLAALSFDACGQPGRYLLDASFSDIAIGLKKKICAISPRKTKLSFMVETITLLQASCRFAELFKLLSDRFWRSYARSFITESFQVVVSILNFPISALGGSQS